MPSHQDRIREKNEPKLNELDRIDILRKAHQYLVHSDEFVRILAQIAIYHYND